MPVRRPEVSGWLTQFSLVLFYLPVGGFRDFVSCIFLPVGGLLVASSWLRSVLVCVLFSLVWLMFSRLNPLGLSSAWLEASHTQVLCVC